MLDKPNKRGLITILYFLFGKLNDKRSRDLFKHVFPPYDRKQEAEFQKICLSWWKECMEGNNDYKFSTVPPNLFMKAGGNDVIAFVSEFSTYVLYCCTNRLCAHDDFILLPPKSCQNHHIETFQKVSLKGAIAGAMSSFTQNIQLSRPEDVEAKAQVDSVLTRYRQNMSKVKDLKEAKRILIEQLKISHTQSHGGASKKDNMKSITSAITSDLNSVRKMWDLITSSTDETGGDREIVRSILSPKGDCGNLSAIKLGVKIPSLLIRDSNQEVSERVGPTLYQAEQLNLVGFIRLVNIMLQQILLKLRNGLPSFSSTATVLKAHNIIHSKCSKDLTKVQHDFDVIIPQVKNMNILFRERVDQRNHQYNLNKEKNEMLIPGLPIPDLPSTDTMCNLTEDLEIATGTKASDESTNDIGLEDVIKSFTKTYPSGKVTLTPVILPLTGVGSSDQNFLQCEQGHANHDSLITNDLAAASSKVDMLDSFSSLKQGHLSFGPSSPLKDNHLSENFGAECTHPTLFQQIDLRGKVSSVLNPTIIDKAKPRKLALDKLVDRVVDFTIQETDSCSGAPLSDTNLMDMDGFDLACQLDTLAFGSVDKVMRSPLKKS